MNAEYRQQLYGGEISDHFTIQSKSALNFVDTFGNNAQKLEDIYNVQVKPVGAVAVTHSSRNLNPSSLIEREPDPIVQQLQATLTKIATEHGLIPDSKINTNFTPDIKDQSIDDIQQANDAVAKALEELKALNEL